MKKVLLGVYLPIVLMIPAVLLVLAFTLIRNPQIPAYIVGEARLHNEPIAAKVIFDGVELPAVVYSVDEYKLPGEGRTFLVYPTESRADIPATMVDIDKREIGRTNFDESKYKMFPGRNLIQMSSAYAVIWSSDGVKWGYDPKMTVEGNRVTYFEDRLLGENKLEIIFENNL